MATGADTLRVLEWDLLRRQLAGLAHTPEARRRLEALEPFESFESQTDALAFASECLDLLAAGESLPMQSLPELTPILHKAAPAEAQLEGPELVLVGRSCELHVELSAFGKTLPDRYPLLKASLSAIAPAQELARRIRQALDPDGTVLEGASSTLQRLWRTRQQLERTLLATLEKLAARLSADSVVTLREGRYVVSVPERQKSQVPGIVHDRSQSGTTYFIEPLAALESGNRLRAAEADIRDEIRRILRALTALVAEERLALAANGELVTELDVVWCKARWAHRLGARVPARRREPELALLGARHPLLLASVLTRCGSLEEAFRQVVPFALSLSSHGRALVISGPNTGGKTVCLKTLGLVVLLLQSGVPATVAADCAVGDFDRVIADIGDDQSLALSLSTFSAHLKHVGEACRLATERTLVLLDELGVGTDPEEGGALALAVLESLLSRRAAVVVTTHHPALKLLAPDLPVRQAAFTFQQADLAPTYELVTGRPGQSYALDVAARLDFPPAIVSRARELVSQPSRDLSQLLDRLALEERELAVSLERQAEAQTRLDALLKYTQEEEARWRQLHGRAEAEARSQVSELVSAARQQVEKLVAELRRSKADPQSVKAAHRELAALSEKARAARPERPQVELEPGMLVTVSGLGAQGYITRVSADGERISVRIGNITYTVTPDRLAKASDPEPRRTPPRIPPNVAAPAEEIDVRGLAADEAILEVDSAIEAARASGQPRLRVIHGQGSGVLRRELSAWLKRQVRVAAFRSGRPGEGSGGVTFLELAP